MHLAYVSGNDDVVLSIIMGLQKFFPKSENGFCEIEHYCFDNNFGKPTPESEYKTIEDFYNRLINKI